MSLEQDPRFENPFPLYLKLAYLLQILTVICPVAAIVFAAAREPNQSLDIHLAEQSNGRITFAYYDADRHLVCGVRDLLTTARCVGDANILLLSLQPQTDCTARITHQTYLFLDNRGATSPKQPGVGRVLLIIEPTAAVDVEPNRLAFQDGFSFSPVSLTWRPIHIPDFYPRPTPLESRLRGWVQTEALENIECAAEAATTEE